MTHPGSRYVDPEPPSYCEIEVEEEGDFCEEHEPTDEPDYWDEYRDRMLDERDHQ
jgi:hypothetical protein